MEAFGRNPINFFRGEPSLFQPLVIGTDIWKGFGYNTVVYLAAILGVDQSPVVTNVSNVSAIFVTSFCNDLPEFINDFLQL